MKKFLSKYWKACLSLAFGVAVFLFWRYGYYYALSYQEQFQLFLFDSDYFMERLAQPGGLARYLGEFIVQFYNSSTIGALLIAILYVVLQRLTYLNLVRRMKNDESRDTSSFNLHSLLFLLSFLPPIALWFVMGDENVMLTYVIALIIAMLFMLWKPKQNIISWIYLLIIIPLLYWLIGPMVLLTALVLMPLSVIYALVCIFISAYWVPYPLSQLMVGVDYYRFVDILPYSLFLVPVLVLALCYGVRYLHKVKLSVCYALAGMVVLLMVLVSIFGYDAKKYELIEYDYLVRIKDWNGIIAKAEKKTPDLPMSVCATNLALAITNQLGDRAFDFYQRGREGLLPPFERNFTTAQLTGEIYYYLGLINTAQRFAFESMEALPNYNKSGRIIKRLVETNMINGQYEVARKYLQLLEKTIFYRPWAEKTLALLHNPQQINQHPVYGWLRKVRLEDDFLFSEDEVDKICGQLFMHNTKNAMAMQYLLMTPLLDRDLNRFMQYLQVVQEKVRYNPR
ncbi:MAG: hypothetical protein IIT94_03025, partial [Prevotella sp.]|nr:hypothetical protein [Prevotella sp.]